MFVRRPSWVAPGEIMLAGATAAPQWINGYLFLAQPPVGTPLRLRFPLKESTLTLTQHVHAHPIRLRLRGDSPLAMDNFETDLTFFEPYTPLSS